MSTLGIVEYIVQASMLGIALYRVSVTHAHVVALCTLPFQTKLRYPIPLLLQALDYLRIQLDYQGRTASLATSNSPTISIRFELLAVCIVNSPFGWTTIVRNLSPVSCKWVNPFTIPSGSPVSFTCFFSSSVIYSRSKLVGVPCLNDVVNS